MWEPAAVGELFLGRFRYERSLGNPGSIGRAILARDELVGDSVVCKVPLGTGARPLFLGQYKKLLQILSPYIVRTLGYYEIEESDERWPIVVMEWIDGAPVSQWKEGKSPRQRLRVVSNVATALADLHRVGIQHGDLTEGNVLVTENRVTLIDPGAKELGSTVYHTSQAGIVDDFHRFVHFARETLGADTDRFVRDLLVRLEGDETTRPGMRDVAEAVAKHLSSPLPGESSGSVSIAADWHMQDVESRRAVYRRARVARSFGVAELVSRISAIAEPFGVRLEWAGLSPAEIDEKEASSDSEDRGTFLQRSLRLICPDGNRWSITFESVNDFRKPWPDRNFPGLLGRASSEVFFEVGLATMDGLELTWDNERVDTYLVWKGRKIPFDEYWITRSVRILVGLCTAGLQEPKEIKGGNLDPSEWPKNLAIEDGDIVRQLNGYKEVSRAEWLKQYLRIFLGTRPAESKNRVTGSELGEFPAAGLRERASIARRVATQELERYFGNYLEVIYRFDVEANQDTGLLVLEMDVKPVDNDVQTWKFEYTFS